MATRPEEDYGPHTEIFDDLRDEVQPFPQEPITSSNAIIHRAVSDALAELKPKAQRKFVRAFIEVALAQGLVLGELLVTDVQIHDHQMIEATVLTALSGGMIRERRGEFERLAAEISNYLNIHGSPPEVRFEIRPEGIGYEGMGIYVEGDQ